MAKRKKRTSRAKTPAKQKQTSQDFVDAGLPRPVEELLFAKEAMGRRWRADFAYEEEALLIEIDGGVFSRGRHVRPVGFIRDAEKLSAAAELGYFVLRYTPNQTIDPKIVDYEQIWRTLNRIRKEKGLLPLPKRVVASPED